MAKPLGEFSLKRRSKTNRAFVLSISPQSGLPLSVCQEWRRRSLSAGAVRIPQLEIEGRGRKRGQRVLIALLREDLDLGVSRRLKAPLPIGKWLEHFISLGNNLRAERLISGGLPYSPDTIDMYKIYFNRYIADDPFLEMDINAVDVPTARAFVARIGTKRTKDGREP